MWRGIQILQNQMIIPTFPTVCNGSDESKSGSEVDEESEIVDNVQKPKIEDQSQTEEPCGDILPDEVKPEDLVFKTEGEVLSTFPFFWSSYLRFSSGLWIFVDILPSLLLLGLAFYFDPTLTGMLHVKLTCLLILCFNVFLAIIRNKNPGVTDQERITVKLHAVVTKE